jgi:hypothetical protein
MVRRAEVMQGVSETIMTFGPTLKVVYQIGH